MASTDKTKFEIESAKVIGADPWLEKRLDHPEDIAITDNGLLYAGGEDGQLYQVDLATGRVDMIGETGGFVLGIEIGPDGNLYACDFQKHAVFQQKLENDEPIGQPKKVLRGGDTAAPLHPNYLEFDQDGRMYISDSGRRDRLGTTPEDTGGSLYVFEPDGTERLLTDRITAFPNGIALSADAETLYVCESGTHVISAVHLKNGSVDSIEPLTDECGMVDGITLDSDERLYVASIGDNAIYRYENGSIETLLHDSEGLTMNNPTNVAFGGKEMQTLYIANLGLWHVTAIEIEAVGRHPTGRIDG